MEYRRIPCIREYLYMYVCVLVPSQIFNDLNGQTCETILVGESWYILMRVKTEKNIYSLRLCHRLNVRIEM